jgi:hydroxypyruvate reductase
MHPERFLTHSLSAASWGKYVTEIMAAALDAVDPYDAVRTHVRVVGEMLVLGEEQIALSDIENIYLVGAGKAGLPMARAVVDLLGDRIFDGVVIVKEGHGGVDRLGPVKIREASHPLPDQRGVVATRELLELLSGAGEKDLVLCVISGGGSALLTAPVEGFSLDDLRELTDALLASGAGIEEINTLRKQLDLVKGGGLARAAFPAQVASLILSDVVGNPLGMIASGPTVPNLETSAEAIAILDRYDLLGFIPENVFERWQAEDKITSEIKFEWVSNILVGSNVQAAKAALREAKVLGLNVELLTTRLEGEAREVGEELAGVLRRMALLGDPFGRPGVLIAGGETTVTLQGSGRGGRNQELALVAVEGLDGLKEVALVTLATDGGDGVSDGAGAVVTGETMQRALAMGLKPKEYLAENDSASFFKALGDQIVTGPTQTNVNDLVFLFVF